MRGQLLPDERKFLYDAVVMAKPKLVLEVGTWCGGGSTLQIAEALLFNGFGRLITCEIDVDLYSEAFGIYNCEKWAGVVECRNVDSSSLISELIAGGDIPDFLFFDGPEDPDLNLKDLLLLEGHLAVGSYFCAHDWDLGVRVDGGVSVKSRLVRPYVEGSGGWDVVGGLTYPVSVGIVLARYRGVNSGCV